MDTWTRIAGLILAVYAAFCIYRGRISVSNENDRTTTWITRSEKPLQFWLIMVVILALAAILGFNVFNF